MNPQMLTLFKFVKRYAEQNNLDVQMIICNRRRNELDRIADNTAEKQLFYEAIYVLTYMKRLSAQINLFEVSSGIKL